MIEEGDVVEYYDEGGGTGTVVRKTGMLLGSVWIYRVQPDDVVNVAGQRLKRNCLNAFKLRKLTPLELMARECAYLQEVRYA